MARPIRVGITHGDINGIGYEVILKSLADEMMRELCTPVIFGSPQIAEKARRQFCQEDVRLTKVASAANAQDGRISVVDVCGTPPQLTPANLPRSRARRLWQHWRLLRRLLRRDISMCL